MMFEGLFLIFCFLAIGFRIKIDICHIKENIKQTAAILAVKMGIVPLAVVGVSAVALGVFASFAAIPLFYYVG